MEMIKIKYLENRKSGDGGFTAYNKYSIGDARTAQPWEIVFNTMRHKKEVMQYKANSVCDLILHTHTPDPMWPSGINFLNLDITQTRF